MTTTREAHRRVSSTCRCPRSKSRWPLLEAYRVERVADDDPVKGPYHWQPGPRFEVRLAPAAPGAATPLT
jgi:hypothetical protein